MQSEEAGEPQGAAPQRTEPQGPAPGSVPGSPRSAAFSSMLIGISGGRAISIADSVKSIVQAAVEANRVLRRRELWDRVRIDEVEFIELTSSPPSRRRTPRRPWRTI